MHFDGDLGSFHPADILMFLSQLRLDGILAVNGGDGRLSLVVKQGVIVDGHSAQADDKMLRMLLFLNFVDQPRYQQLFRVKAETGMPVRQILDTLGLLSVPGIRVVIEAGVKEVLFTFFSLENGSYQFADVSVETDGETLELDGRRFCLEMVHLVDECRDIERNWGSLDRVVRQTPAGLAGRALSVQENTLLRMASGGKTIRQIVQQAPFPSFQALKAVNDLLVRKWLKVDTAAASTQAAAAASPIDPLFVSFKRAFKRLLSATQIKEKVAALATFCKDGCERMAIFTSKQGRIVQCIAVAPDSGGEVRQQTLQLPGMRIDDDPLIGAVERCGIGFFGKAIASRLVEAALGPVAGGECAVVPVASGPELSIMLYAYSSQPGTGINPFHYLELLSWMLADARQGPGDRPEAGAGGPAVTDTETAAPGIIGALVNSIDDLPPLPAVVSRILKLLADPNASLRELEVLVGQDQALTVRLIKIGNSALYGATSKVSSLRQALARLGTRTVKSLVLAASTANLFPRKKSGIGMASQLLWRHAVECGLAARRLAMHAGIEDPEEAFAGGMLHDIGKLVVLLKFTEHYHQIERLRKAQGLSGLEAETRVLGSDHTRIGDLLMEKWKMPQALCDCVRYHHCPEEVQGQSPLVPLVACGNHLSHFLASASGGDAPWHRQQIEVLLDGLNIGAGALETLRQELLGDFQNHDLYG